MTGLSEAAFQRQVIGLARWYGWRVTAFRPALRQSGGYSTPVQGDPGYCDLTLAKGGVVLHVELKTSTGRQSDQQKAWAREMGAHYRLWRPTDGDEIRRVLSTLPRELAVEIADAERKWRDE